MTFKTPLILGLILCVVAVFGCTSDTSNFNTKHFENENVSFDYPDTWEIMYYTDLTDMPLTEWMIKIQNPDEQLSSVQISEWETPNVGTSSAPESIKIDNVTSREAKDNSSFRMFTFTKNGRHYRVTFYGDPDDLKEYKAQYDTIVKSIRVQ